MNFLERQLYVCIAANGSPSKPRESLPEDQLRIAILPIFIPDESFVLVLLAHKRKACRFYVRITTANAARSGTKNSSIESSELKAADPVAESTIVPR